MTCGAKHPALPNVRCSEPKGHERSHRTQVQGYLVMWRDEP